MSKMEFFLQKPLTVFAKSSMLDVYLTDFPKFVSDWEIQFMKLKLKLVHNYIHKLHKLNYINYINKFLLNAL